MSRLVHLLCAAATLVLAGPAQANCYSLFDAKNRLVYRSPTAPIDTSKSFSEETERLFPGHFLVFEQGPACEPFGLLPSEKATPLAAASSAPAVPVDKLRLKSEVRPAPAESEPEDLLRHSPTGAGIRPLAAGSLSGHSGAGSFGKSGLPTCYRGPRGGTYTITPSGRRNYSGC